MAIAEAERRGLPYRTFHQRRFEDADIQLEVRSGVVSGFLTLGVDQYPLDQFTSVYTRLMDDTLLPELQQEPIDSALRRHCRRLHHELNLWFELCPARVVNRSSAMGSNGSKPYQAQLIRSCGFDIPQTLVTNDPDAVREFRSLHGRIVYKSISGARSVVSVLREEDEDRLNAIRGCPTQFQECVEGTDVRVHVIGKTAIATEAWTEAVDYRYAAQQGHACTLIAVELAGELRQRCVDLAQFLHLDFAGIDLMRTTQGRIVCFEVNPCPAYSFFEQNTAQPIASTLVSYLAWESD
jgi:hypothetical protein